MAHPRAGRILNLCDHEPAPQGDVIRYAADLLGVAPPTPVAFEDANLSPMARTFYITPQACLKMWARRSLLH